MSTLPPGILHTPLTVVSLLFVSVQFLPLKHVTSPDMALTDNSKARKQQPAETEDNSRRTTASSPAFPVRHHTLPVAA